MRLLGLGANACREKCLVVNRPRQESYLEFVQDGGPAAHRRANFAADDKGTRLLPHVVEIGCGVVVAALHGCGRLSSAPALSVPDLDLGGRVEEAPGGLDGVVLVAHDTDVAGAGRSSKAQPTHSAGGLRARAPTAT